MAGRSDEVEKDVDTIVTEAGVTLDTRLLGENVIVLTLEVADNLAKAMGTSAYNTMSCALRWYDPYLASLSIWSPKPGVSTMVREIRVPSSSSSNSRKRA